MISQAFACTGPYALLIMLGIKRVENRSAAPEPRRDGRRFGAFRRNEDLGTL